jgi:hypothetical protein
VLKLIELAQVAHRQCVAANPAKQAKILKCVSLSLVFDRAIVSAAFKKPFDVLAERPSSENWLPLQDVTRTRLACLSMREAIAVQNLARVVAYSCGVEWDPGVRAKAMYANDWQEILSSGPAMSLRGRTTIFGEEMPLLAHQLRVRNRKNT